MLSADLVTLQESTELYLPWDIRICSEFTSLFWRGGIADDNVVLILYIYSLEYFCNIAVLYSYFWMKFQVFYFT